MKKIVVKVGGMSCMHCSAAVERALKVVAGVHSVSVDLAGARAELEIDDRFNIKDAETAIADTGYDFLGLV